MQQRAAAEEVVPAPGRRVMNPSSPNKANVDSFGLSENATRWNAIGSERPKKGENANYGTFTFLMVSSSQLVVIIIIYLPRQARGQIDVGECAHPK